MRYAFTAGVDQDLPASVYHEVDALSSTFVKDMAAKSALHAQHRREHGETNEAMRLGTALHTRVLMPGLYAAEIAVAPKVDRRSADGKAAYAAFQESVSDRIVISEGDHIAVLGMELAIRESHAAQLMLGMAREREVSIFSEDAETGVQLKARLDAYDPESGWVVDIKTCQTASAGAFRSALSNSGWAIQAAFYRRVMVLAGLKFTGFVFICVEKDSPHGVGVYSIGNEDLDLVDTKLRRLIVDYKVAKERNVWPGYPDKIERVGLAAWAAKTLLEEGGTP